MYKILFTICGRAGSKGVKNKNIKNFNGVPLVYYTIAAIKLFIEKNIDKYQADVVLNTDSHELIDIVSRQSVIKVAVINRSSELGGDAVPKVSVIKDCFIKMDRVYDTVVDLDITSPIRTVKDITNAVELKLSRPDMDVVYSVTEARRNPYFNMVKIENGYSVKVMPSKFTMRQQAPEFYDMNASIYAYSVNALLKKDPVTFFSSNCGQIIMKDTGILDIDSEEDYEIMQVIAKYISSNDIKFGAFW